MAWFDMDIKLNGLKAKTILQLAQLYDCPASESIKDIIFDKLDRAEKEVESYIDNCTDEKFRRRIEDVFYIDDTESELKEVLGKVPDKDLELDIDDAVSRVACAYECLGFVMGYLMRYSGA